MEWVLLKSLIWETEKPLPGTPRESSPFSFQGCKCSLKLSVKCVGSFTNHLRKRYYLLIKSDSGLESFQECNIIVYVKNSLGFPGLVSTNKEKWWEESACIWSAFESDVFHKGCDYTDLLRFFILLDDCPIERTPCLNSGKEKSSNTVNSTSGFESLSEDLSKLLADFSSHDVKLKCGDQTIGAHRNILSARSQVFSKMFRDNRAEGDTGVVEIQDMDEDILEPFIRYLYTGMLPEMTLDMAKSFYEAGNKYTVEGLIRRSFDFLKENLTQDNASDILVLADTHNDQRLKKSAIVYMLDKKMSLQEDCS